MMDHEADRSMTVERLSENVSGVIHNLNSSLMVANGYIDLLAGENKGGENQELCELARRAVGAVSTIVERLDFAMRAIRSNEAKEISLNASVQAAVELLRSNREFRSKVKFEYTLAEDVQIIGVPRRVMQELDTFFAVAAEKVLADGDYRLAVQTAIEPGQGCVKIGPAVLAYPRSPAES